MKQHIILVFRRHDNRDRFYQQFGASPQYRTAPHAFLDEHSKTDGPANKDQSNSHNDHQTTIDLSAFVFQE